MKPLLPFGFVGLLLLAGPSEMRIAADAQEIAKGQGPAVLTPGKAANSFDFDTDHMAGTICLDGAYHGLTRLVDKRTGRQVIDTRYAALNLFKLQAVNACMGQPRDMKRLAKFKEGSDWAEARWAATEAFKGEITARYHLRPPGAIDIIVTVRSQGTYPGFEIFMSSYFDKVLQPHVYLQTRFPREGGPELVVPTVNEVFRGTVLVFPRDAHAARRCLDGRWDRGEFNTPTVQMCPVRRYGHCLAFMTDPERKLGVVLMALPRHCYAISTRYHAAKPADRLTSYSAFDLSLFGDDLLPGEERTVRVRLAWTALDEHMTQPLELYRAFLQE